MKKLKFHYNMTIEFTSPISNHNFKLKCLPKSGSRQTVSELNFEITPNVKLSDGTDGFGNLTRYGNISEEHTLFGVNVEGVCEVNGGFYDEDVNPSMLGLFKVQTPLTKSGEALTEFGNRLSLPEGDNLTKSRYIMHEVYKHFEYVPKATGIATSAEESFALGKGVCQDYSQSMLSICRSMGIPCRYVTGLLMGEGETHAWAEIYSNGKWYGLDPTNDVEVSENHIVISTGRDSADCSINRGIFRGNGTKSQKIYVKVEEVHDTKSNAG